MKFSSLTQNSLKNAGKMLLCTPIGLLVRKLRGNVWIITERPDQARDNGYCFFKYLRQEHPEQNVYYIIDPKSKDYQKVASIGKTIPFDSWKHYFYYCLSPIHISAHVAGCNPNGNPVAKRLKNVLKIKDVFLPHGVSYGISEFCLAKYAKLDLFICCGKPEYDNVLANYGYSPEQVAYTGFPRLDGWHHIAVNPKQIVLMPTWRLYLAQNPDTIIEESSYFKAYSSLLRNKELHILLSEHGLKLVFYLHHNMQKYASAFQTDCPNIEIVYRDEQYDIQELLKSSALLITDYSSVHFDFAYMNKPVIYYQFDREEFFSKQYEHSSFDAEKDGFGPIATTEEVLVKELSKAVEDGFSVEEKYHTRMRVFYQLYDEHNCERVYEVIKERVEVGR